MDGKNPIKNDLLLKEDVRRLLDDFAALMKLHTVFFSSDGRIIERGRNAECSSYCRQMQSARFGLDACFALDRRKQTECRARKTILSYVCHAGLGEIVAPVMVFGETAGFIVMGQFRVRREYPALSLTDAEKKAYDALPLFCGGELHNLEHMVQMLLECIVAKELVSYPQDLRMLQFEDFVDRRLSTKITLAQTARALCCSESTLTHYLRREQHVSFSRFVTEKRIARAEKLFLEHPDWTLAAVAEASGFESIHYFSRVFCKLRGMPPGKFKKAGLPFRRAIH